MADLNITVDSSEVVRAGQHMMQFRDQTQQMARAARQSAGPMSQLSLQAGSMGRTMNRMGVLTQQAGYQVGDFIVQVQSGTNAFVAFGQQATQVAGTLTLLGGKWIMIGTALGIAIPLLTAIGAAFMRTRQSEEQVTRLSEAVQELTDNLREAREESLRISLGAGSAEEALVLQEVSRLNVEILATRRRIYELEQIGAITSPEERRLRGLVEEREELERLIEAEQRRQDIAESARQAASTYFARREATQDLEDQIALYQIIARFGEDSVQAEEERHSQAREAFRLELERSRIYGEHQTQLLTMFDTMVSLRQEAEAYNAALYVPEGRGAPLSAQPSTLQAMGAFAVPLGSPEERGGGAARIRQTREEMSNLNYEMSRGVELQLELAESFSDTFGDALVSMVDGTKSVSDAFKDMARSIISELYDVLVVQQLVGQVRHMFAPGTSSAGSGILGGILGVSGKEPGLASGGSMMANRPYMVGERGPELVIPGRSSTVVNSDLTGKMGGGQAAQVINMSYNFTGGVTEADLARAMPQMVEQTKRAVVDTVQRGGNMARVFR